MDEARWALLMALREDVQKALELARGEKLIGSGLEAAVTLYAQGEVYEALLKDRALLPALFIVSAVELVNGPGEGHAGEGLQGVTVAVAPAAGQKCERCWRVLETVGEHAEHPTLCPRCAKVVEAL